MKCGDEGRAERDQVDEHISSVNWKTQWSTIIIALPLAAGRLGRSSGRGPKTLHSTFCRALDEGRRFAV